jgi:hypothetical protein
MVGCVRSVWVHEKNPEQAWFSTRSLKGIPFRTKTTIFEQVTTWEKRWKKVTLQRKRRTLYTDSTGAQKVLEVADPPSTTRTPSDTTQLANLRSLVATSVVGPNLPELQIIQAFQALPQLDMARVKEQLAGNELKREEIADPHRELYLNSPLPWFGTSSLTAKLASDGTLSEAVLSAETRLAEGISTLLPIKEVLSAVATKAMDDGSKMLFALEMDRAKVAPKNLGKDATVIFDLTIEDEGLIWEFRRPAIQLAADGHLQPIPFEPVTRPNSVKPLPTENQAKQEKKSDDRKLSISGEVTLPKETAPPK